MFKNAGNKIKSIAIILFWTIVAVGTIEGLALTPKTLLALLLIPVAVVLGYALSLALYAFGDMCENIDLLRSNIYTVTTIMEKRFPDLVEEDSENDEDVEESE